MESLDLNKFPKVELPRFLKIKQNFKKDRVENIELEVADKVKQGIKNMNLRDKRIAVGVGSCGIANIAEMAKTVVDCLKEAGAKPFIIPAMGSHGGATPEGQAAILASYGITEETMGVKVDASVDVEPIGEYEPGLTVYVAKSALEADGVIIIPRIKPHTCFRGKVESGACKMLVIGLGKQRGADSVHSKGFERFHELMPGVGCMIAKKIKLIFAVSTVENAYDDTYKITILTKDEILGLKKEETLLEESRKRMAQILIPKFDVLVIGEIGKNISGDGQDPNVTGLYFTKCVSGGPEFKKCAILDVTDESHGNTIGIGVADVTTRKLFDKIDFISMYTNSFTSTETEPIKIPMVARNAEDAVRIAVKLCNGVRSKQHRIVWIKNTMELGKIWVSEPLLSQVEKNPRLEILTGPKEIEFEKGEPVDIWE
ncbi:nickel pincer cofactor-dependent isomerase, group 22 [Clostridium sp. JNZ X4-2]